jgi:CHAT domain-containing protein
MYTKLLLSLLTGATITCLFTTCTTNTPILTKTEAKSPTFDSNYARAYDLLIKTADNFNKTESVDSGKLALPIIEKLVTQTDDSLVLATYAEILFEVGYAYQGIDLYDSSYPYLQKSLDVCLEHFGEDYLLTTMCLNKLSFYYYYIGDLAKERENLFRSFRIRRKICDSMDIYLAYGYGNMGAYYYNIGDIAKANLFKQKAGEIISYQYQLYNSITNTMTNDTMERVVHYFNRFPKWKNAFLTNIPRAFASRVLSQASHYLLKNNYSAYLQTINDYKAVTGTDSISKKGTEFSYYVMQSEYFQKIGDNNMSDKYIDSSINSNHNKPIKNYREEFPMVKVYILMKRGNIEAAKKVLYSREYGNNEDKRFLLAKYYLLSSESNLLNNEEKTISYCDSSYHFILSKENYTKFKNQSLDWDQLKANEVKRVLYFFKIELLARMQLEEWHLHATAEQLVNLFDFYHKGTIFLQERNFTTESKIFNDETDYPIYEKAIGLAIKQYNKTHQENYFLKAVQWSDGIKALSLKKSILNTKVLNDTYELSNVSDVIELENMIDKIQTRIKEEKRDTISNKEVLFKNLNNSLVEYSSQLEELREKYAQTLQIVYNPNDRIEYPMAKIKSLLTQKNACLMDYFVGDQYIHASMISSDTFISRSMQLDLQNKDLLKEFLVSIKSTDSRSDIQTLAEQVYALLLKPFAQTIAGKSLIIIPDGILYKIPFELLEDQGIKLIDEHSVQYEYSAKLLLKKAFLDASVQYTGFAPEYKGNEEIDVPSIEAITLKDMYTNTRELLGPLKFNIPEVVESAFLFKGRSFVGTKVDKQVFLTNSKDTRILHLAMHAITDDQNPDYSQLFFKSNNKSEPLFAYELNEQELKSELAILSACNTGVGTYRRGDGVQSLARAFKAAGCKNIVMSLWPANDASTKDIVVGFLKKLKAGMGKADALRQSKLDYLQTAPPELKQPYYWAGLVLIGDNEAMDFGNNYLSSGILIFLLLTVTIFSLVVIRRKGHFA